MENREIALLLSETADLMEIAGEDGFRIRSYRNGASVIDSYPERVEDILKDPDRKVTDIPGIGKGLAAVLQEIAARGSFERRDELLSRYPHSPGTPQNSRPWTKEHRVNLEPFPCLHHRRPREAMPGAEAPHPPRMGAKLEEKVLRSIAQYRRSSGRFLLSFATNVAAGLTDYLNKLDGIDSITTAGSVRRGRETVGDLDLLVTGPGAAAALDAFVKYPQVHEVLVHGENKASARLGIEGLQVDVRALPKENYGAALQYFTGSKEHSIALRGRALKLGLTLNEYGLFRLEDNTRAAGETEESLYETLGLDWIPLNCVKTRARSTPPPITPFLT